MQTFGYQICDEFSVPALFLDFQYDPETGSSIIGWDNWKFSSFKIQTTINSKKYPIYGVRGKPTNPYLRYSQRFYRSKAQIKSKDIPQRFLFEQKEFRHKEYELGFEIEVQKAQFKSLSVTNEFVVLAPINKKSYIFAFNVFTEQNRAKIYKRI